MFGAKEVAWVDGPIKDVLIDRLDGHADDRGYLVETFREDEPRYLLLWKPMMGYFSTSKSGVVRGPHEHREQADLFVFVADFEMYLWDARTDSPTFGNRIKKNVGPLSDELHRLCRVYVPPGVVHAYRCLEEGGLAGVVLNFPDRLYRGPGGRGEVDEVRHEDDPDSPFVLW